MNGESDPTLAASVSADLQARLPLDPAAIDPTQIIYRGRNCLLRCVLADGRSAVVKQWQRQGPLSHKVLHKARASFRTAQALRQLGIATPQPFLWWGAQGWWQARAAYVCAEVPAAVQIRVLHGPQWITNHQAVAEAARACRHEHLHSVGALAARLHQAGWRHRDFTAGNILLAKTDDQWTCYVVDLNRCQQRSQVSWRQGIANLVQLEFQDPQDRDLLLSAYCQARDYPLSESQACYDRYLKRHLRRFALKNATRTWRHPLRHRGA